MKRLTFFGLGYSAPKEDSMVYGRGVFVSAARRTLVRLKAKGLLNNHGADIVAGTGRLHRRCCRARVCWISDGLTAALVSGLSRSSLLNRTV